MLAIDPKRTESNRMKNRVFIASAIMLIMACTESPPASRQQVRDVIAVQLSDIETMINEGHPAQVASALYLEFFSANPSVLPYGGELLKGQSEVKDFYTRVFSMGTLISNVYSAPTIEVADGFAVRTYEGTAEIQMMDGSEVLKYTNVYSDVLVPENGEWKIFWHSWVPAPVEN